MISSSLKSNHTDISIEMKSFNSNCQDISKKYLISLDVTHKKKIFFLLNLKFNIETILSI